MKASIIIIAFLCARSFAHGSDYLLAVPVAQPGSSLSHKGPILRYEFDSTGALIPMPAILQTRTNDPIGVDFNKIGELFVGNRHGNTTIGSVGRFPQDKCGNCADIGLITGNNLSAVQGVRISPWGELFAANISNKTISRFIF